MNDRRFRRAVDMPGKNNPRTLGDIDFCDAFADATGCTGDDSDFPVELAHEQSPPGGTGCLPGTYRVVVCRAQAGQLPIRRSRLEMPWFPTRRPTDRTK